MSQTAISIVGASDSKTPLSPNDLLRISSVRLTTDVFSAAGEYVESITSQSASLLLGGSLSLMSTISPSSNSSSDSAAFTFGFSPPSCKPVGLRSPPEETCLSVSLVFGCSGTDRSSDPASVSSALS